MPFLGVNAGPMWLWGIILVLAANTSYAGFPRLCQLIAQFTNRRLFI